MTVLSKGCPNEECSDHRCLYRLHEISHWSGDGVDTIDDLFIAVLRFLVPSNETFPNFSIPKLAVKQTKLRITKRELKTHVETDRVQWDLREAGLQRVLCIWDEECRVVTDAKRCDLEGLASGSQKYSV